MPTNRSRLPHHVERMYRRVRELTAISGQVDYGENLRLGRGAAISSVHGLVIGHSVSVGRRTLIEIDGTIGDYCLMGSNVQIIGRMDHAIDEIGVPMAHATWIGDRERLPADEVEIGRDVWIGAGAIILGGISIGDGSIVAAGAVVTRNIPPFTITGGNPARAIKQRFETDLERSQHLDRL
jgi:acetyltransferase-like isoleucine patch superfamily enzyme